MSDTIPNTPEAAEASQPIAENQAQEALQEAPKNGKLIESDKLYAIKGQVILGIVDLLRKKIPTENAGIVYAVEDALATAQELEVKEKPE